MKRRLTKIALLLFISSFVLSCSSSNPLPTLNFTSYQDFKAGPEGGVDLVWARAGLRNQTRLKNKLAQYDTVVIDRIFVLTSENNSLDDAQIAELTQYLVAQLTEKISPFKPVVDTPQQNSLRLSIAISDVETPNPLLAITSSLLPVGLGISTISKIVTGEHTNVGSATIELLASDANTQQPLFAAIDKETGNKDFLTMIDSLDDAKDAINWWVARLGKTLDGNFL